jgi:hypothetical protein
MLSGFTIVRNAVKLDFPIIPAIRSVLEVCDEVVVNVGKSEDETRDLVTSINDPRVRIVDTEWDLSRQSAVLADATDRAMAACRGRWGLYIQADEVLHEDGARILAETVRACDDDPRVEGLLVRYLHFYGSLDMIATNRRRYRREVRCVRLGGAVHAFQDAQGFRVGPDERRIRARRTDAVMFHYGWARPAPAIHEKLEASKTIFPWGRERSARDQQRGYLEWEPLLRRFSGAHPRVAHGWVRERMGNAERRIGPRHWKAEYTRLYVSDWIERLTGLRVFEYRNYRLV